MDATRLLLDSYLFILNAQPKKRTLLRQKWKRFAHRNDVRAPIFPSADSAAGSASIDSASARIEIIWVFILQRSEEKYKPGRRALRKRFCDVSTGSKYDSPLLRSRWAITRACFVMTWTYTKRTRARTVQLQMPGSARHSQKHKIIHCISTFKKGTHVRASMQHCPTAQRGTRHQRRG